jgi:large conductance mechanosensitive channel
MQPPIHLPKKPGWVTEFQAFIMRGNVVDLAVGVIIGAAFTGIVNSLVKDLFTPILGVLTGGVDFSNIFVPLNGQHYDTLDQAQKAGAPTLNVGLFLNACIQFLIISFVIFMVVKAMSRFIARKKETEPPPPPRSEVLLEEIRDLLRAQQPTRV